MCGRFTLTVTTEDLLMYYSIQNVPFTHQPRFNIAPGQMIPAIIGQRGQLRLGQLKWGLVPSWAKDNRKFQLVNAKAETLWDKPSFKSLISRKRCIIPADGFYEWKQIGKQKQPLRITMKTKALFSMAALYDSWAAADGSILHSCTIITTTPNKLVQDIHDRMPVILKPKQEVLWLDRAVTDRAILDPMLRPYPAEEMTCYPVATIVGNVKNDNEECIKPAAQHL
jgi:putative SOS response-associated peptidase YedK